MSDILLADIGGTTSRLAFTGANGRPDRIISFANDSVAGPEAAITRILENANVRPRRAVLAIAGPIEGDEIRLTNRAWCFRLRDLSARFGLDHIHAVNDFEALAWALPLLDDGDVRLLGACTRISNGTKIVLGPGTGLGVAALVASGNSRTVVASEGGHVSFGPHAEDEAAVFSVLRAQRGQVTAETILSGPGLTRLHHARDVQRQPLPPEEILNHARAGDPHALATIALFVRLLGRFAGDTALTFKATGGVYVTGGVALGLGDLFDSGIFREAFEAHPPYEDLLRAIPTSLVICEQPGLLGCAALARQVLR